MEKKRRSTPWLMITGLAILGVAGLWYVRRPAPPIDVDAVKVEKGEVRELVTSSASGEVKAARRVTVRSEIAGTVSVVKKARGDRVKAGELVVAFTSDELDARLSQADANVEAARVAVGIAEERRGVAARALERAKKLRASDAISDVELDRADTEASALGRAIDQAKAALKQAEAARTLAHVAKKRASVTAPFDGVLQDVVAEVGVMLAPAQPLFDLIDDSSVRIEVPIDESDIARVTVGQKVFLRSEGQPGRVLGGVVSFIPPAVGKGELGAVDVAASALTQKDRSMRIHVAPDEPAVFRVGASVNAELLVSSRTDVLFVPSHVVLGRGVERSVYRIEDGVVKKVPFVPGLTSWERTEVRSGLALGDVVVSSLGAKGLEPGVRVKLSDGTGVPKDRVSVEAPPR
ncbi:efflux RND transporter periplasmic adaptor subunit [Myxococcota bacterium]|nr:efflux RND transporter periplasmic adaptor subunit [Myxococcota bacterium]